MNNFFKKIALTIALLAVIGGAWAEEPDLCEPFMGGRVDESLLATMLSAARDGRLYRIQPDSSQVGFCVDSKLSRIEGNFTDFRGGMQLDPVQHRGDGQTLVLIRADSLTTKGALIRQLLKGASFFDVEQFPEVLFVSSGIRWTGPDTAVLTGELTLRGITRPISFDVVLTPMDGTRLDQPGRIMVKATATIERADFGMDALDSVVDGDVQLCMTVVAHKYESLSQGQDAASLAAADHMIAPVPALRDRTTG